MRGMQLLRSTARSCGGRQLSGGTGVRHRLQSDAKEDWNPGMSFPTCILPRACSDALESHVAEVVGAEVLRTLAKCGLAEVVARLQEVQVRGTEP